MLGGVPVHRLSSEKSWTLETLQATFLIRQKRTPPWLTLQLWSFFACSSKHFWELGTWNSSYNPRNLPSTNVMFTTNPTVFTVELRTLWYRWFSLSRNVISCTVDHCKENRIKMLLAKRWFPMCVSEETTWHLLGELQPNLGFFWCWTVFWEKHKRVKQWSFCGQNQNELFSRRRALFRDSAKSCHGSDEHLGVLRLLSV